MGESEREGERESERYGPCVRASERERDRVRRERDRANE